MKRLEDIKLPAGSAGWLTEAAQALQERMDFLEAKIDAGSSHPPKKAPK